MGEGAVALAVDEPDEHTTRRGQNGDDAPSARDHAPPFDDSTIRRSRWRRSFPRDHARPSGDSTIKTTTLQTAVGPATRSARQTPHGARATDSIVWRWASLSDRHARGARSDRHARGAPSPLSGRDHIKNERSKSVLRPPNLRSTTPRRRRTSTSQVTFVIITI